MNTMTPYIAEFVGTALMILLGDGVCANIGLAKSKGFGGGWIVIATGWGLAVMVAVYAFARQSGAHFNPAITIGLASIGRFPWAMVPGYIIAQTAGGVMGGVLVWLTYLPHWKASEDTDAKLWIFCTIPAIRCPMANFLCEIIGATVLVFGALSLPSSYNLTQPGWATGFGPLLIGLLIFSIGLSLGGPTGYAINPARDLGPRIAHAILPIAGKGGSDWGYAWVPIVGPIIGGVLGALSYKALIG
jgi:glycerol uptake facilitator protein